MSLHGQYSHVPGFRGTTRVNNLFAIRKKIETFPHIINNDLAITQHINADDTHSHIDRNTSHVSKLFIQKSHLPDSHLVNFNRLSDTANSDHIHAYCLRHFYIFDLIFQITIVDGRK